MLLVIVAVGALALLIVAAASIDFRARRRGVRYTGIDQQAARDERRKNEADLDMRSGQRMHGSGSGGTGGI